MKQEPHHAQGTKPVFPGTPDLEAAVAVESLEVACQRLAELLGRDEPVAETVLRAAVDDPLYAMHLLASRSAPRLLAVLLENPPKPRNVRPLASAVPAPVDESTPAVMKRFGRAMIEWGKAGFKTVDEEVYKKRLAACGACPNLRGAKGKAVEGAADAALGLGQTCALCGCYARAKARIARENCPGKHPEDPLLSRWGEPF